MASVANPTVNFLGSELPGTGGNKLTTATAATMEYIHLWRCLANRK
jgi:hypothetical protein